jgi:DNA-binding response OmpR family regulator
MQKDKILIIEKSELIKNFLDEKLTAFGFETIISRDVFDGLIKMKNNIPDLVILDYELTQNKKINFFNEKRNYKTISEIPIIMLTTKIDKGDLFSIGKFKVNKIFTKPIKIDLLLNEVSGILNKKMDIDATESMVDVHLNDDILFVEISRGFNRDKIDSLKYKIKEIKTLYKIELPKVLIIIANIEVGNYSDKLFQLVDIILNHANPHQSAIKILTASKDIKSKILSRTEYGMIEVTDDINRAIEKLSDIRIDELINKDLKKTNDEEISWATPENAVTDGPDEIFFINNEFDRSYKIAVVDDDDLIRDLIEGIFTDTKVVTFTFKNGKEFVENVNNDQPDLVFLDLLMPVMDGFMVLEYLYKNNITIPVIVFSAMSKGDTVKKALSYGIKSYIIKPVTPDIIFKKAVEALDINACT